MFLQLSICSLILIVDSLTIVSQEITKKMFCAAEFSVSK